MTEKLYRYGSTATGTRYIRDQQAEQAVVAWEKILVSIAPYQPTVRGLYEYAHVLKLERNPESMAAAVIEAIADILKKEAADAVPTTD